MGLVIAGGSQGDDTFGLPGIVVPQFITPLTVSTGTLAANQAYFWRFYLHGPLSVAFIAYECTTQDAGDPGIDVGIYDASFNRLGSSGALTGKVTTTGVKKNALTATVNLAPKTVYYAAFTSTSATPGFRSCNCQYNNGGGGLWESAAHTYLWKKATSNPLPNPVSGADSVLNSAPVLALRSS